MNYKYNEIDYAKLIYEQGFQDKSHMPTELRLAAIYMRRNLGYKPAKLKAEFYAWCSAHIENYSRPLHYKAVNKAINQAVKKGSHLICLPFVPVYTTELHYINNCKITDENGIIYKNSGLCRKLLFTLMVQMKINMSLAAQKGSDSSHSDSYMCYKGGQRKYNELKKAAKLPQQIRINEDIIHHLYTSGLVTPLFGGLIRLDFMNDIYKLDISSQKPAMKVEDFERIGWYFDYYNHEPGMLLCSACGKPFRRKTNRQIYCSDNCAASSNRQHSRERKQQLKGAVV